MLRLLRFAQLSVRLPVDLPRAFDARLMRLLPPLLPLLLLFFPLFLLLLLLVVLRFACELEVGEADPHFDVIGSREQESVELPRPLQFAVLPLEIDVGLPEELRHVEARLVHGEIEDGPRSLHLAQHPFHFGVLRERQDRSDRAWQTDHS